jgi:membrane-associated phospholipid phosphatase
VLVLPALFADLERIERGILHFVTCTAHDPRVGWVLSQIQRKEVAVPIGVVTLLVYGRRHRVRAVRVLLTCLVAFGIGSAVASVLWPLVARPRPTSVYERLLRTEAELATCAEQPDALAVRNPRLSKSYSFPSRHALAAGVVATAFLLASPWLGSLAVLFGLAVIWGRLYIGRHWPTDALAGAVLGIAAAWAAWHLVPRLLALVGRERWVR